MSDSKGSKASYVVPLDTAGGFGHDSVGTAAELPIRVSEGVKDSPEQWFRQRSVLGALDSALFVGRYVLIASDNTSPSRVSTLDQARAAVANGTAATAAGRLADGLLSADIDAECPVIGDACAEALIAWCTQHGVPYILRDSGRAGGRHVIAVVTDPKVPVQQWARLCRKLSRLYETVVQDRSGQHLRLLSAPHRIGLPAPVLACTATLADVIDAVRNTRRAKGSWRGRRRAGRAGGGQVGSDHTRSGREFGATCAMARAGWTARQAWQAIRRLGGKSADRGEQWWRRYMWLSAVTVVCAEEGLSEDAAWERARKACSAACLAHGRGWWRKGKWAAAVAEAETDRPRRRRLEDVDPVAAEASLPPEQAAELATVRTGLSNAVTAVLGGLHPQRRRSVRVTLDALARVLVTRSGSVSGRDLAVLSRQDRKTVRRALAEALAAGLVVQTHAYAGGATDCDSWGVGPRAIDHIAAAQSAVSPTRCTTPAPQLGRANPARLHRESVQERRAWTLRCDALAALAPGERLADSRHPAAKLLRSLYHQRTWWRNLSAGEQQDRREVRQAVVRRLDRADRSAWVSWLSRREEICAAADRLLTHQGDDEGLRTVLAAPLTVHRGMADPRWRTGGTPVSAAA